MSSIPGMEIDHKNYNYAPVAYLKSAMLGLEFDNTPEQDAHLEIMGETASRMIDNYTQQIFYFAQIRNERKASIIDHGGNVVLRAQYKPLIDIHRLRLESVPQEFIEISKNVLDIHYEKGTIIIYPLGYATISVALRRSNFMNAYFNTVLTYDAGYREVPSVIQRATALLVRNMLIPGQLSAGIKRDSNTNKGPKKKIQSGRYTEEYATDGASFGGASMSFKAQDDFLFTSDIQMLLRPYIKRGVL